MFVHAKSTKISFIRRIKLSNDTTHDLIFFNSFFPLTGEKDVNEWFGLGGMTVDTSLWSGYTRQTKQVGNNICHPKDMDHPVSFIKMVRD